jgi:hypothetical protein
MLTSHYESMETGQCIPKPSPNGDHGILRRLIHKALTGYVAGELRVSRQMAFRAVPMRRCIKHATHTPKNTGFRSETNFL